MQVKAFNETSHVWDVKTGDFLSRPVGVRHEIAFDADSVTFREVWFFSDNGEVTKTDERTLSLNNAVHLMVNITDAECHEFAEVRTTRPSA